MRRKPTTIASIGLALAVVLSAAGLFNNRMHADGAPAALGSPDLLMVAGK